jgi:hypothetical protein
MIISVYSDGRWSPKYVFRKVLSRRFADVFRMKKAGAGGLELSVHLCRQLQAQVVSAIFSRSSWHRRSTDVDIPLSFTISLN